MALLVFGFWLLLCGRIAPDTLTTGAAITALMLLLAHFTGLWTFDREKNIYRLLPSGIIYFFVLIKEIFAANIKVIKTIIRHDEKPCIRHYITTLGTKAARAMLANSITLTPGTVTVQLVDNVLTVHCLTREMADALDGSALERRLKKMEEMAYGKAL